MADRETSEEKLALLRELDRSTPGPMPMSASCVINRGEVLAAIDDVIDNLPDEIADAQHVIDRSQAKIAEGEAEAGRIMAEAREHAAMLAQHSEVVRVAEQQADQLIAEAEEEAAALRRETDHVHRPADGQLRVGAAQDARARSRPPGCGWPSAAAWTGTADLHPSRAYAE